MEVVDLSLTGLKLITPKVFFDDRGSFSELFRKSRYQDHGIDCEFVQDNHSFSKQGTIRGMHYQSTPGQAKLVSVVQGEIFDVVVDIRPGSSTYGQWEGVTLDAKTLKQLFVPIGFAHGFCVLSDSAHVIYKVSSFYEASTEKSFRYDDPKIGIRWPVKNPVLSERDLKAPVLEEFR